LNKQDIKYQNRCITSNEIEAIIKRLPTKKSTGPKRLTAEFYQNCKELIPTSSNFAWK
jgi:hypothetical protein